MKETFECPRCEEWAEFEFSDDYWENEQGEYVEPTECPKCGTECYVAWEVSHYYSISGDEE